MVKLGKLSIGEFHPTDKLLHTVAYFGLVAVWKLYFILKKEDFKNYKQRVFIIAGVSAAFGILIEVVQGVMTSYRQPDGLDILANTAGIVLAIIFFLLIKNPIQNIKKKD